MRVLRISVSESAVSSADDPFEMITVLETSISDLNLQVLS